MRPSDPRSAAAALLSFIFPGVGQAYNGQWVLAALLAIPVLLIGILGVLVVASGGSGVASRLLDARILVALIVLDVTLLGWRLIAIVQAHGERSRLTFHSWTTWLTAGLVVLTIAMHALPAYYATKAIDTLGSVSLEGGGGLGGQADRRIDVAAPSNQPDLGLGERITVLLVGIDFAPGRDQHLTDTMLVATLDPKTGEGAMISVPRDLYGVPLGDGRVYNAKLNSLLATASADPDTYPEGGPATLKACHRRAARHGDPLLRRHRHRGPAPGDRHHRRRGRQRRAARSATRPTPTRSPVSAASISTPADSTSTAPRPSATRARGWARARATSRAPSASRSC